MASTRYKERMGVDINTSLHAQLLRIAALARVPLSQVIRCALYEFAYSDPERAEAVEKVNRFVKSRQAIRMTSSTHRRT